MLVLSTKLTFKNEVLNHHYIQICEYDTDEIEIVRIDIKIARDFQMT